MPEKFRYVNLDTGELSTSIWGVIRSVWIDLVKYRHISFRWGRFDDSIYR